MSIASMFLASLLTGCGTSLAVSPANSVSKAVLTADPATVTFGTVTVGETATQSITLTSSGTAAVTLSSASATGTGFSASGLSVPASIAPGTTATLNIQFAPSAAGSATGTLSVASNGGSFSIPLAGTGQEISYQVQLSWAAPQNPADPPVGYDLYRATGGSSTYELVDTTTTTAFADAAVTDGQTYAYYVTSVDAKGSQSSPSNVFKVTVP